MEKITIAYLKDYIINNNIPLAATHKRLCFPIIKRIYQKMNLGIKFDEIKVCDNLIIDGHHRYLSAQLCSYIIKTISSEKTSATQICNWNDIIFDEEDWDTKLKIEHLNKIDADYNKIDLTTLNKIISCPT